jgi:hypothetical protein
VPRKIRELKADLRAAGFTERPGKGSQTVWHHSVVAQRIVLDGGDGDDAKQYQERAVRTAVAALSRTCGRQE